MADITTRAGKGSPLTNNEVDANFTNLNTDKAENGANSDITSLSGVTGGISEADYLDLDISAVSSRQEGRIRWNNSDKTAEIDLHGSSVTLQVGQENVLYVYNNESSDPISNGDVVYIYSAVDQQVSVRKYIADGTIAHGLVIGVATEDIAFDSFGYISTFGMVRGIDTSAFSVGDLLYASATTAGALVNVKPSSPNKFVEVGTVVKPNATEGLIFVSPFEVHEAEEVFYNNADSGLAASNVKAAIDELEIKKADVSLLQANLSFYATTAASPITGYNRLVTSVDDADFNDVAVDVNTGTITNAETLIASLASDADVLDGSVSGITITTIGQIRRSTGNSMGRFWFAAYKRDSGGTETLLATSPKTEYTEAETYTQFYDAVFISTGTVASSDRVVLKFYGQTDGSDATFDFRFGGDNPIRTLFPVAVSVIPQVTAAGSITADASAFGGILSGADTTVQAALDTIDDHGHGISDITLLQATLDAKALKTTTVSAGTGLTGGGDLSANRTISHADTSSAADLTASSRTYVDGITFDEFGHVTGYSTSTETVVDTDTVTRVGVDNANYTSGDINFVGTNQATVSKLGDTVTIDVSVTDSNNYANSLGFSGGTLTIGRQGLSSLSTSLDGRYLQSETDPVFSASEAANITVTDTTNWDTAYSWGNHATAGYLPQNTGLYNGTYNIPIVANGQLYPNPAAGAVTITGSTGTITATTFSGALTSSNGPINVTYDDANNATAEIEASSTSTGGATWRSRISSKNTGSDRSLFMAQYNGNACLAAHNAAYTAWAPLYLNAVSANASGGNVYCSDFYPTQVISYGAVSGSTLSASENSISISGDAPTLYYKDNTANAYSAFLHNNANLWYVLNSAAGGSTWASNGNGWPIRVTLSTSDTQIGRNLSAGGNITAYSSDRRLKKNIKEIPDALEKVARLRGCTFDWREDTIAETEFSPDRMTDDVGLIAQEVQAVMPQATPFAPFDRKPKMGEDGMATGETCSVSGKNYLTVDEKRLVPLLVQAIKELKAEIDELKGAK